MVETRTGMLKVLDCFRVSPPSGSVPTTSLPLTYFDFSWVACVPIQRLFFYEFPHPTLYFMETTLPLLKRSLSLTLQHFFPYASNIMCPQSPGKPYIYYTEGGSSVTFTVAESAADFDHVVADYPRDVKCLHPFVPQLPPTHVTEDGVRVLATLAFQVTVFPNSGICIGSSYCHAVGDGKSFMHFMRSWTSVFRSGGDLACLEEDSLPLINRDVIKDPVGLESIQLKNYWRWVSSCGENSAPTQDMTAGKVRATFVLNRALAERLKHLVTAVDSEQHHISTFVVSCALIWVCLIKSKESIANNSSPDDDDDKFYYFLLACDGRNRLEFPVPTTYFGNCLQPCVIDVKKSELTGEDGIVLAAKVIGKKIKEMEGRGLRGAEHWASTIIERVKTGRLTPVAGSPKLRVYDTDFGWGRPRKVELTHIDYDGAISMTESRDGKGGTEVGVALNKTQMDEFVTVFEQDLKQLRV